MALAHARGRSLLRQHQRRGQERTTPDGIVRDRQRVHAPEVVLTCARACVEGPAIRLSTHLTPNERNTRARTIAGVRQWREQFPRHLARNAAPADDGPERDLEAR